MRFEGPIADFDFTFWTISGYQSQDANRTRFLREISLRPAAFDITDRPCQIKVSHETKP